jgi:hypothetical protein
VIWGALNGLYLIFALVTARFRERFNRIFFIDKNPYIFSALQILTTFVLSCIAWIFFRAGSINDAIFILTSVAKLNGPLFIGEWHHMFYSLFAIAFLLLVEYRREFVSKSEFPFTSRNWVKEQLAYSTLIILILLVGVFDGSQFIYFQF